MLFFVLRFEKLWRREERQRRARSERSERTPRRSASARRSGKGDERPQGASRCPDEVAVAKIQLCFCLALHLRTVAEKGHRRLGQRDGGSHAVRSVSGITATPRPRQILAKFIISLPFATLYNSKSAGLPYFPRSPVPDSRPLLIDNC